MQLKRFFKVSDPGLEAQNKHDKLYKIRELWEDFISRCKLFFWPAQQVGVDEAIKKFKGRCSFKQYIKSKPVRWGLKIFCLCCSLTGYLWNAQIYVGKNDSEEDKKKRGECYTLLGENFAPASLVQKPHCAHGQLVYIHSLVQ
jgi:Transposase IS4